MSKDLSGFKKVTLYYKESDGHIEVMGETLKESLELHELIGKLFRKYGRKS